jgi:hypothetical protein
VATGDAVLPIRGQGLVRHVVSGGVMRVHCGADSALKWRMDRRGTAQLLCTQRLLLAGHLQLSSVQVWMALAAATCHVLRSYSSEL